MAGIKKIVAGGQTGVDQAALDAAMQFGIPCGGWCPPGRLCENGIIPEKYPLTETPCEHSAFALDIPRSLRTEWNVRDADAVLILSPLNKPLDAGTQWTAQCAATYHKNILIGDPYDAHCEKQIIQWLQSMNQPVVLNIAGPSESLAQGIGEQTRQLLSNIFDRMLSQND